MFELENLSKQSSFIFNSSLKDLNDTGGIFDTNMRVLAYFRHEQTWRTPRGPIRVAKQARATDIYLENSDGELFGEINEIPPKLVTMRLIRKFEIYNNRKELAGVVREKPKAFGSDWVLENVEEKVIAFMVGDRKKKEYKIQTPDGDVLAKCFRDASLGNDSYRVDVFGGGVASYKYDVLGISNVDLFLVLCYIVVLDLAKTAWMTRDGFVDAKMEKEHLVKTRLVETQVAETKVSKKFSGFAFRNLFLAIVQAFLVFTLATLFLDTDSNPSSFFSLLFGSSQIFARVILYAFGVAILVTAFIGVAWVKNDQSHKAAMVMGGFGVFSLFISGMMFQGVFGFLVFESMILTGAMFIVGVGIIVNVWFLIGLFG